MEEKDWRVGDIVKFRNRRGRLLSKPYYVSTPTWGLYYAKVKWNDSKEPENFCVSYIGFVNLSALKRKKKR